MNLDGKVALVTGASNIRVNGASSEGGGNAADFRRDPPLPPPPQVFTPSTANELSPHVGPFFHRLDSGPRASLQLNANALVESLTRETFDLSEGGPRRSAGAVESSGSWRVALKTQKKCVRIR